MLMQSRIWIPSGSLYHFTHRCGKVHLRRCISIIQFSRHSAKCRLMPTRYESRLIQKSWLESRMTWLRSDSLTEVCTVFWGTSRTMICFQTFGHRREHLNKKFFSFITLPSSCISGLLPPLSFSSSKGQGLFSPVGQDRQWVHRPSPERVLLVKLGTKHLALC